MQLALRVTMQRPSIAITDVAQNFTTPAGSPELIANSLAAFAPLQATKLTSTWLLICHETGQTQAMFS